MDRPPLWKNPLLYGLLGLVAACYWWNHEIRHGPGQVAPGRPAQRAVQEPSFEHRGVLIHPRALYQIEARVLGTERYLLDPMADISPIDVALGWGPMSDERVLDKIDISQSGRFVFMLPLERLPISQTLFHLTFSNVHMIPANDAIERVLRGLRRGHVVRMQGMLVDVDRDGGPLWRSSLERTDYGNGACEVFFATRVEIRDDVVPVDQGY